MKIEQTELAGVLLLRPTPFHDHRGFFSRTFDAVVFDEWMATNNTPLRSAHFLQDSQSRTVRGGVRGLHGRRDGEAKLVRCAHGAVLDVVVDIRRQSPTFGRSLAVRLDDTELVSVFIPRGFLHGFQCLTDTADVCYRIDKPHDQSQDIAVAHNDADLAIGWPQPVTALSERDAQAPSWAAVRAGLLAD